MLLVINANNTNTVFAMWDRDALKGSWRTATEGKRTADEYVVWLDHLLSLDGLARGLDLSGVTLDELRAHDRRFGATVLDEIRPERAVASRRSPGGTAPERVREALAEARSAFPRP